MTCLVIVRQGCLPDKIVFIQRLIANGSSDIDMQARLSERCNVLSDRKSSMLAIDTRHGVCMVGRCVNAFTIIRAALCKCKT